MIEGGTVVFGGEGGGGQQFGMKKCIGLSTNHSGVFLSSRMF